MLQMRVLSQKGSSVRRSRGFSIGLNVKTAFLKAADTVGTSARTIFGENVKKVNLFICQNRYGYICFLEKFAHYFLDFSIAYMVRAY